MIMVELNGLSTYVNVTVSGDQLFIVSLFELKADTLNGVHGTEAPVTSVAAEFSNSHILMILFNYYDNFNTS